MITNTDSLRPLEPLWLVNRFPPLQAELIVLLRGLGPGDWARPTACALWSVRDITAHLLDDDLRRLSFHRDGQPPPSGPLIDDDASLVALINRMNAEWVAVARRMSPRVLIELLEVTGPMVVELFRSIDPYAPAHWPVAWAGEAASEHWFDVGRDYTERWLHQQQIRDAVGAPPLAGREWLHPVLALFVRALPMAYAAVDRPDGTAVLVEIEGPAGDEWTLRRDGGAWRLLAGRHSAPQATVSMSDDTAWRLFSKGLRGDAATGRVRVAGDQTLGEAALGVLAVMA
ncbi:MAG: maleylpyruvate isomerase family mycothiol-dependent enzyme [Gemmatimonadales bacterium]